MTSFRATAPAAASTNGRGKASALAADESTHGTRIQSVARASKILMLVAALPESDRTMSRLAQELATSVPTVYHLVNTLVDSKLLTRDAQRRIHLGVAVGTLGTAYAEQTAIPPEYLNALNGIVDETGENAYLSAWREHDIVIQAQVSGTHSVLVSKLRQGYHGNAHARASGKALLAFASSADRDAYLASNELHRVTARTITSRRRLLAELDRVRQQQYATEEEEFTEGVACLSVPVFNAGALIGAFTVTAPIDRYRAHMKRYLLCLQRYAKSVDE